MMIGEYLKNKILITDGATGTYYSQLTKEYNVFCELANLTNPDLIRKIHSEYVQAGAKLIRTNTFSVNTATLGCSESQVKQLITSAMQIAKKAISGDTIFIAANIGPIPEPSSLFSGQTRILEEYRFIVDTFLEEGANIFNFETFSNLDYLPEIAAYIKAKQQNAFILTQFVITANGSTRSGMSLEKIISQIRKIPSIDAYGFNCGIGPTHLSKILNSIDFRGDLVAALPNAGYPEVINERTVYVHNPDYFAERILTLKTLGIKILGGCCGTTPEHIKVLASKLQGREFITPFTKIDFTSATQPESTISANSFKDKLKQGKFVIAAELDPPYDTNLQKLLQGASAYQTAGINIITIADSPLAKARVDSVAVASKIKREIGIDTLPHICCRDKNINALKSAILAAHIEKIRNILIVTGDPLPGGNAPVKNVFNFNSFGLIKFLAELNNDLFGNDPITIGAALNLNVANKELELERMKKKQDGGACFFLTQPIFDDQVIDFLPQIKKDPAVKILAGLLPIVSYRNALFLKNELPGVTIPNHFVSRFDEEMDRNASELAGIELAVELAEKIRPLVDGFYFITPFNRTGMIVKILKRLKLGNL